MISLEVWQACEPCIVFTDPADQGFPITIMQEWDGPRVQTRLRNDGDGPVRIHEVVMADIHHEMPGDTKVYGEGFTHLSATGGTIAQPTHIGSYTDLGHYRLAEPECARTVYGILLLSPSGSDHVLLGFSTCLSYCGKIHLMPRSVQMVLDTEDIEIDPGQEWRLEDMVVLQGSDRAALLGEFADKLAKHHRADCMPDLPPAGWCSWYCFGPGVTADDIRSNQSFIREQLPELKFIQIDDGYQAAMGDWLATGRAFGGGIRDIIKEIKDKGCEPAIWVAPFVAQEDSRLFREHPDWFVMDQDGNPLRSDRVTFGGWRCGPWYALDGTHPRVQMHLQDIFHTMHVDWGINYFKLDACFWGAMHGGRRFDPKATRIQAYRQGLRAIRRGADWSLLLGCNHPTWPSLGIVQAGRTSDDIARSWKSFTKTGIQNLMRSWLNGTCIWNDPDCVILTGDTPENEFVFHATVIYASGGSVLSGDNLPEIPPHRLAILRKLLPPTGQAAAFTDETLEVGQINLPDRQMVCLFNWEDEPKKLGFALEKRSRVTDFWTDEDIGEREGMCEMELRPHSARLLECVQV